MDFTNSIKLLFECLFTEKSCSKFSIEEWSIIIVTFFAVVGPLYKSIKYVIEIKKQNKLKLDLHPYYSEDEINFSTKNYITTQGQNIAPSRENEPGDTHAFATRENLIKKFLNDGFKDKESRFFIVLADSGMGKTTFMLNLYLKYVKNLSISKKYNIKLFPLGYPNILDIISKIENKGNTIILLDALDEDQEAVENYKFELNKIIDISKDFRKVVITCRTQFFPNEDEENIEIGLMKFGTQKGVHIFRKIYISPFNNEDIKLYLNNKYGRINLFTYSIKKKAQLIVNHSPNLVVRPMLLSYIDDLTKSKSKYNYTFQIYEELINKWIEREARRVPFKKMEEQKIELFRFSKEVAMHIYNSKEENKSLTIDLENINAISNKHHINLNSWELTGRSLLNRDAIGRYKFAHKSILEFFIALEYFNNSDFEVNFTGFDNAKYFIYEHLTELLISFNSVGSQNFTSNKSISINNLEDYLKQANLIYNQSASTENIDNFNKKNSHKYISTSSLSSAQYKDLSNYCNSLISLLQRNETDMSYLRYSAFEYMANILSIRSSNQASLRYYESPNGYVSTEIIEKEHVNSIKYTTALSVFLSKKNYSNLTNLHSLKILNNLFYLELILIEETWANTYVDIADHLSFINHFQNIKALLIASSSPIANIGLISNLKSLLFLHIEVENTINEKTLFELSTESNLKVISIKTRFIKEQLKELDQLFKKDDILLSNNTIFININNMIFNIHNAQY